MSAAFPLIASQKRFVRDRSRFTLLMASRQTGKTSCGGLKVVDGIHEAMVDRRTKDWVILSSGERLSKELMQVVRKHAHAYQLGASDIQEDVFKGTEGNHTQLRITFPGGSVIDALPANPDTARGYPRNLWLDEFSTHQQSREIWAAAFPIVSANFDLLVTGTPKGKSNKFYELWTTQRGTWSRHSWDIYQAVAEGLDRDIAALKENMGDDELWAQEYELQFIDEATAWFTWDLINSCEHTLAGLPDKYEGNECVVGVDIASGKKGGDLFVIQVLERVGDVWWHREEIAERVNFKGQDELLDGVMKRYRVTNCFMDETGIGHKPVEDAQRRYGSCVLGIAFSPASKQRMATSTKKMMEDRRVRIGAGNDDLRQDLHKIKREIIGDRIRFSADRDSSGHADRATAFMLALDAASAPRSTIAYTPIPARHAEPEGLLGRIWSRMRSPR